MALKELVDFFGDRVNMRACLVVRYNQRLLVCLGVILGLAPRLFKLFELEDFARLRLEFVLGIWTTMVPQVLARCGM